MYFYGVVILIKDNKFLNHNSWITSGIKASCRHIKELYIEFRKTTKNPTLRKYYKGYCQILSKVIKGAKRLEYDKHVLKSDNLMRTSWKLINKELGKDNKNHGIQSVNIDGRSTANQQIIADACNKLFTTTPNMIDKNINANYCLAKTSVSNQNKLSFSLKHAFQNSFPSIK